ncbi:MULTISPECIES: hypothetical protein [Pandoraea]|uniref:Plasmid related protein n=1 Tax=Pandoraea communis TaxID=2508297 RepID=A0A5E4XWR1_9BURK|nr:MULTISPECIES: hypothetical protein [Pandoraea]ALS66599.1 hypothetical protein AT395_17865 [Pandoraea apista]CFB61427.1 hypothetical protein LMG16407_01486 [Pandoraea apista]VVE40814.1 hypothetical protein PCO31110_04196 [Pandoraea communis]
MNSTLPIRRARLPLGRLLATPAAVDAIQSAGASIYALVNRHACGDWGDLPEADREQNDLSVVSGRRVLSCYPLGGELKVWIVTDADRSTTTILLPEEY